MKIFYVCVLVDLPAKYEREADVEREVELVDVVKICARTARDHQPIISRSDLLIRVPGSKGVNRTIENQCDGHFRGPWGVVRASIAIARVESYRA